MMYIETHVRKIVAIADGKNFQRQVLH